MHPEDHSSVDLEVARHDVGADVVVVDVVVFVVVIHPCRQDAGNQKSAQIQRNPAGCRSRHYFRACRKSDLTLKPMLRLIQWETKRKTMSKSFRTELLFFV